MTATSEQMLTTRELAERWRCSTRSLERWRAEGTGPAWVKLGAENGPVRYRLVDVLEYEMGRRATE